MLYRIYSAIEDKILSRQLPKQLNREDIFFNRNQNKQQRLNNLFRQNCDMFILSLPLLPDPVHSTIKTLHELPESPAIVLFVEHDDPLCRVEYLANGADAVLDSSLPLIKLVETINTIIDTRIATNTEILSGQTNIFGPRLVDFVSSSESMKTCMMVVKKVVNSDSSLLITGETGVGKERLARAIHEESHRSIEPFIPVNCAALPDNLLESELFGHEIGAFTGATRARRGIFELAHKGTVFLDEIGDLPFHLQGKLLRVLQEQQFFRVGGEKPIEVDVRVMTATNKNIMELVEDKKFRQDLFYRIGVIKLEIPPLRNRKEDIPNLVQSYIQYFSTKIATDVITISDDALKALVNYIWPGNVRELMNVIERAMLLCEDDTIMLTDLPEEISLDQFDSFVMKLHDTSINLNELPKSLFALSWKECRQKVLDNLEKAYLTGLLRKNHGRIDKTAKAAGIDNRSLYQKMRKHQLDKKYFKK